MTTDHLGIIAIGFVVSFITAIIVVKDVFELRHPATALRCSPGGVSSSAHSA